MTHREIRGRIHVHNEAFMLMAYTCEACKMRDVIYNARDGVTPFAVPCRMCDGGLMTHRNWTADVYAREHIPEVGDLMFLDTSAETLLAAKRQYVEGMWTDPDRPMSAMFPDKTKAEVARALADEEWAEHDGHVPSLVTMTKVMRDALEAERHV